MEQLRHQTGEAVNDPYCTLIQRIKKCRDFLGRDILGTTFFSISLKVIRKEFYYEHIKKYNGRLQAISACTLV
jgi:hypothetical protein